MKTEKELKEYANLISQKIAIRTYNSGNSSDDERVSTLEEQKIIHTIVYGGLLAINEGKDKKSIISACEYISNLQFENVIKNGEINSYMSIYIPMMEYKF